MGGEEAATAAGAFPLHEPGQRIDHDLLRLPDATEKRHAVLLGCPELAHPGADGVLSGL
jgi:hypothetical protein